MDKKEAEIGGKLYLCATPIGNLEDITLRVLRILGEVDLIAAEDTRHTRKLLTHYDIHRPLVSFNQVNEGRALPGLIAKLRQGKNIALVSDAGTPGIADPGHSLVRACLDAGIEFEILPGASAALAAAVVSGLPTHDLRFLSFLPRRAGPRRRLFSSLADTPSTLIFYESPRRLMASLTDIAAAFGGRRLAVVRELTKFYEERVYGDAAAVIEKLSGREIKGEVVIVIEGATGRSPADIDREISAMLEEGLSAGEISRTLAAHFNLARRGIYEKALRLKK